MEAWPGNQTWGGLRGSILSDRPAPCAARARSDGLCSDPCWVFVPVRQPAEEVGGRLAWARSAHGDARMRPSAKELPVSTLKAKLPGIAGNTARVYCPQFDKASRPSKARRSQANKCTRR